MNNVNFNRLESALRYAETGLRTDPKFNQAEANEYLHDAVRAVLVDEKASREKAPVVSAAQWIFGWAFFGLVINAALPYFGA